MKPPLKTRGFSLVFSAILFGATVAMAGEKTFYVSTLGNDQWDGSAASPNTKRTAGPVRTLERAVSLAREFHQSKPSEEARILMRRGEYLLDHPLTLSTEDSNLRVSGEHGQTVVLTGEGRLTGWHKATVNSNLWETTAPGPWRFHELFVNGVRKQRARLPVSGYFRATAASDKQHPGELHFQPGDLDESLGRAGDSELVLYEAWAQSINRIRSVDTVNNTVSLSGTVFPNDIEKNPRYFIENAPEVTQPGQWRMAAATGLVTYWPEAGENMSTAKITAPRLYELVHLEGSEGHPIHNVVFDNITLAGTDWPLEGGNDIDTQAAVEIDAAAQARSAEDCGFVHCRFTRLGGYAVDFGHDCQNNAVRGCEMWDLGAGGVRLGDTNPREAGLGPNFGNVVSDNHIHQIGLVQAPAVGVIGFLCQNALIAHNEIDHTFYSTISLGWSWGYSPTPTKGNIVEFNHLHDYGQGKLSDMGAVYTLGLQPGTIIRNNLIHDVNVSVYGGWGLYTDEGSSGIVLESNIVYRCQTAGFHQHYGESNLVCNNIFAYSGTAQVMRTRAESHLSFTFSNNIVYFDSGDLLGGDWTALNAAFFHNIYFDTRAGASHPVVLPPLTWGHWQAEGEDVHSEWFDPRFADAEHGDFRLKAKSPAVRFGFHPLSSEGTGPRKRYTRD